MNPYLATNWIEVIFPFLLTLVLVTALWRRFRPRQDRLSAVGIFAVLLALTGSAVANLFYQRVLPATVWPAAGIFDQVIVTPEGDVLAKVRDPITERADRVQRYDCSGAFKAAYQPDNGGGPFKIAVNADGTLSIFSVRGDIVEVFRPDGAFVERRAIAEQDMPFDLLKSCPSTTEVSDCAFITDPVSGRPAVRGVDEIRPLQRGDWLLEKILNSRNLFGLALIGAGILVISFFRIRREISVD